MKKFIFLIMVSLFFLPAFQSCKRGENDPVISLRSRNARIMAKWKLTNIEGTIVDHQAGNVINTTITFDGSLYTRTIVAGNNPPLVETKSGSYEMTIKKNGKMSWTQTSYIGGTTDVTTDEGNWYWRDSDKTKSFVNVDGGDIFFYAGLYKIDRLANKELVFIDEGNRADNGTTQNWHKIITFKKD